MVMASEELVHSSSGPQVGCSSSGLLLQICATVVVVVEKTVT